VRSRALPRYDPPAMLDWLKHNKRYWVPPILIFVAVLVYVAWRAAGTPDSPFEYRDR
jgi:hypothetical protein